MPDGSSHGDGVLRLFVAIGDGVLWLFNCPIWLNGALKFKSSIRETWRVILVSVS